MGNSSYKQQKLFILPTSEIWSFFRPHTRINIQIENIYVLAFMDLIIYKSKQ